MNILHISTYDRLGGAARSANRLHTGLVHAGLHSRMFVRRALAPDGSVISARQQGGPRGWLENAFSYLVNRYELSRHQKNGSSEYELFSHYRARLHPDWENFLSDVDVINLHWVADFFDLGAFLAACPSNVPLVWTLHDANPFTGGCHYAADCEKFRRACGACPQLAGTHTHDLAAKGFAHKMEALRKRSNSDLTVVTPSRWLGQVSQSSALLGRFDHRVIPYGLDLDKFRSVDRRSARQSLGIDPEARVVLMLAQGLDSPRKGFDLLIEALRKITPSVRPLLVTAGSGGNLPGDIETLPLGHLEGEAALSRAYAAADLYVNPSREDNLPNTVIESLACGTPVAAFDIGGMPDMIIPGRTGVLARPEDSADLASKMVSALDELARAPGIREACRRDAETRFDQSVQVARYLDLYQSLLKGREAA